MYGLVNKAIRDFTVQQAGDDAWQRICRRASVSADPFISMCPYDDSITYALVGSVAEELKRDPEELLEAFGEFWVRFSAGEGYGPLLELWGGDFVEFLQNLDNLHARVRLSFPELRPPHVECHNATSSSIEVSYHSEREGLTRFFLGLLRGLAVRFGLDVHVEQRELRADVGYDRFLVRFARDSAAT
ncbi:MAG: heme NO-binding domain-containing protein [Myxococcota bacterium]